MRLPLVRFRAATLLLTLVAQPARAEEACPGSPFLNIIRPRAIEESSGAIVGPQFFDVAAHPRGMVLFANNNGVISYDGAGFRLTPIGRATVALSVAADANGRIFAGGSRTFGEIVVEPSGEFIYQAFESELADEHRRFSDVWQTLVAGNVVYFRSPERLFFLRGSEVGAVAPIGRFTAAVSVDDAVYAADSAAGLVSIRDGSATVVAGGAALKDVPITAISAAPGGSLIIGAQDHRVRRFDIASGRLEILGGSSPGQFGSDILSVRAVGNDRIAVGTLRDGLVWLDGAGQRLLQMNRNSGLPDNSVLSLSMAAGSLWAGTSGGVVQLLAPSPIEVFGAQEGLPGIVESLARSNDRVFAATSEGVFERRCESTPFSAIAGLRSQAFALLETEAGLLAATAVGVHEIRGSEVRPVIGTLARGLAPSREAGRIWVASETGVQALELRSGRWALLGPLTIPAHEDAAFDGVAALSAGEDGDGRLWISLASGIVVSGEPRMSDASLVLEKARVHDERAGVSGGFAEVLPSKAGLRIGTARAVLKAESGSLREDTEFARALGPGRGAFRIRAASDGGHWVASSKRPLRLNSAFEILPTALSRAAASARILDFLEVSPQEVWIATDDGALRYDPSADETARGKIAARVRLAESSGRTLFLGGSAPSLEGVLPHLASIRFEAASTSFDDPSRHRFRFRLDGQDAEWSPWTAETRKDYTNLGPGDYTFRVETRDVYERVGTEASLSFVVATPWYRKPAAVASAAVLLVGFVGLLVRLRTRSLERRQRELETIVEQKTQQLRDASFTDPLTGLKNRRYFAEIIESEISLACRPASPALHLFLVDLDHFKQVNDTLGHAAGDEVLRQTAARLRTAMRTSDLIFRWGGEEFLIVARGASDLPRNEIANRIVRMIGREAFDMGNGVRLAKTCSVGFATFPFYADNPTTVPLDSVMELADLSLYRAKNTGRNRAVGVSPQSGASLPSDAWKGKVLDTLEKAAVSIEVLEGPAREG